MSAEDGVFDDTLLIEAWRTAYGQSFAAVERAIRAQITTDAEADTRKRIASGIRVLHGDYASGHLCTDAEMHDLLERCEDIARGGSDG